MQTFPIFLALQDRPVLVVGGGEPAARKVELLLAGARVTLIADTVAGEIAQLIAEARISSAPAASKTVTFQAWRWRSWPPTTMRWRPACRTPRGNTACLQRR